MTAGVRIWTIKDNYRLCDNIQSKVLAFAFALSAEIERDLISQRTKEALARRRSEGVVLGRPIGKKSKNVKLSGHEQEIQDLLDKNISKSAIGRILGVNRMTVALFLKERMKK
jgi:DNA invertase Pin-like site-specific DNA recombinase